MSVFAAAAAPLVDELADAPQHAIVFLDVFDHACVSDQIVDERVSANAHFGYDEIAALACAAHKRPVVQGGVDNNRHVSKQALEIRLRQLRRQCAPVRDRALGACYLGCFPI